MNKKTVVEKYLSIPRMKPYFMACSNDINKAFELYQLNMRLAGSFLPLLSIVEVSLRNAIDIKLKSYFNCDDYFSKFEDLLKSEGESRINSLSRKYGTPPNGYRDKDPLISTAGKIGKCRNDIQKNEKEFRRNAIKIKLRKEESFKRLNEFEQLRRIKQDLDIDIANDPIKVTHTQMLADMNFSFWSSLLKEEVYHCLRGRILDIFPNKIYDIGRKEIAGMLDEIRLFRNRVAHNEPIVLSNREFNVAKVKKMEESIRTILKMLEEDLNDFSNETFMIHENLRTVESFVERLPKIIS